MTAIRIQKNECGLCGGLYLSCANPNTQARIFAATKGLTLVVDEACPHCGNSGEVAPRGEDFFTRHIKVNGSGVIHADH